MFKIIHDLRNVQQIFDKETLQKELKKVFKKNFISHQLSFNPNKTVSGIKFEKCQFFTSNARPARICLLDEDGNEYYTMFKLEDDLR